ncbi:MAG: ribonuclease III [Parasphingopyxis sp.]|uniref:ribonuclease III n=1 Tax=Parasphingopyxis sp. TaxID=1920299 RepID=UPI0032EAAC9E
MTGIAKWVRETLGHDPVEPAHFARALTHPSTADPDYQRLEFLGDRVLGLIVADWLYARYDADAEGKLNNRLSQLVSGTTCAAIGRDIGVAPHIRLGKQARDDGAADSDNVLGDVVEALIGALYLDGGLEAAKHFVLGAWDGRVTGMEKAPLHPKSALQEWAAANGFEPPVYAIVRESGPPHDPRFTVSASLPRGETAEAEAGSKREAETEAAKALLEKLT